MAKLTTSGIVHRDLKVQSQRFLDELYSQGPTASVQMQLAKMCQDHGTLETRQALANDLRERAKFEGQLRANRTQELLLQMVTR